MTGGVREKPIDVLLVVDNTGSMVNNKFMFNGNIMQLYFCYGLRAFVVDWNDPAFSNSMKLIGGFMTEAEVKKQKKIGRAHV